MADRRHVMVQKERNKYRAILFRVPRGVVHLVEDMAQPQHTRNNRRRASVYRFVSGPRSLA